MDITFPSDCREPTKDYTGTTEMFNKLANVARIWQKIKKKALLG